MYTMRNPQPASYLFSSTCASTSYPFPRPEFLQYLKWISVELALAMRAFLGRHAAATEPIIYAIASRFVFQCPDLPSADAN